VVAARIAKVGFGGYALAITTGLVLGLCCAWTMRTVGGIVGADIRRQAVSLHERCFRALYLVQCCG
jgi:hypothetical protein